jgi:hypothetical protein
MATEPRDLLIADLEHFGESLWRNEEHGEKILNFFVVLVTAVCSGLVALMTANSRPEADAFKGIAADALLVLLVMGFLTWLRMLRRNVVTDEHKRTLGKIRATYAALCPGLVGYEVPVKQKAILWSCGYAETVGVVEGMLSVAFLQVRGCCSVNHSLAVGFTIGFLLCLASRWSRARI